MSTEPATQLQHKLSRRTARVAVVGLGYVGLPQATAIAEAGFRVDGIDVDGARVAALNNGRSYVDGVRPSQLRRLRRAGRFAAHNDFTPAARADVVTISVPTPLSKTKDPDVSYIRAATDALAARLRPGQLIILESTTYPGTTEEIVRPTLETSGLTVGREVFLAFSPERIDPGNRRYTIANTPKIVAGMTARCTRLAKTFYRQFVQHVVTVSTPRAAETAKLLENTYRSVNIALVNELAMMCEVLGVDVYEVIDAAATKPFGFTPFYPGPGLGGHCIPVDPAYLAWKLKAMDVTARFIGLAGEINAQMPQVVANKVADALNARGKTMKGARLLVLGVTYKADVADTRESPALTVLALLQRRGADVAFHDPYVDRIEINGTRLSSTPLTDRLLTSRDAVLILTHHRRFDIPRITEKARLVVDTRNATRGLRLFGQKIVKLGAPSILLQDLGIPVQAA